MTTQSSSELNQSTPSQAIATITNRLFWRYRARMLFFASCIAIGVGFLLAIQNLLAGIQQHIASQARELMGADIVISSARPLEPTLFTTIDKHKSPQLRTIQVQTFTSMLHPTKQKTTPFLVSVKAIETQYPFFGAFVTSPPTAKSKLFQKLDKHGHSTCLIAQEISAQHGLQIGDLVRLGQSTLRIVGMLKEEPDKLISFAGLAPRVIISTKTAKQTKLLRFGSRIKYSLFLALSKEGTTSKRDTSAFQATLTKAFNDPYLRVVSFADSQPTIREVLQRISIFFTFVSLIALMLGAIGMASSVTTFLNGQLQTVGILRCTGLSPSDITKIYTRLCLLMGVMGGVLGAILGLLLTYAASTGLEYALGIHLSLPFSPWAVGEIFLLSCLLTTGLNYASVKRLAQPTPQEILSGRIPQLRRSSLSFGLTGALFFIGFFLYALRSSYSLPIASFFTFSIIVMLIACTLLILFFLFLLHLATSSLRGSRPFLFSLRHGLLQLTRQRTRTLTFLLALTIGITLISTLTLLQHSLVSQIKLGSKKKLPNLFLVDVQKDQRKGIQSILSGYKDAHTTFNPLIRARLTHIKGKSVTELKEKGVTLEAKSRARLLTREQNLTYKDELSPHETVIAGSFWKPGDATPQVSLERRWAHRVGVGIGDTIRFDIQGRSLAAKVTSIRNINWASMTPNFFLIFPTAFLQRAPQIFIASLSLYNTTQRNEFRAKLSKGYPNVSVIPLGKILRNIRGLLTYFVAILQGIAWICVFIGLIILAGTLSMGRAQRRNKVALMRTLGSKQHTLFFIDFVEFLAIGLGTAVIVSILSWGLSSAITFQAGIKLQYPPIHILEIFVISICLPLFVGLLFNLPIYRSSVMHNLRQI